MYALLVTMMKVLVCMSLGFFLKKINLISDAAVKSFSSLIFHVTAPCLLFSSIATMDDSEFGNAVTLLWTGVAVYVVLILLAILVTKLLRVPPESRGVYKAALIFGNVSFLGIPLAESLYGPMGVFYIALLNIHFNLLFYTYGFYIITADGPENGGKFSFKSCINAGVIGIILSLIFFFFQIPLPEIIISPIAFVGSITSPLSMIVIGCSIATYSLKTVFSQKKIYVIALLRLLVYPIAAYFIFKLLIGNNLLTRILSIYIGMPTASIVGMTSIAYDKDTKSGTSCVAMTTIFSLATIPCIYLVMTFL